MVDLTFRHNHTYALKNGYGWQRELPPAFLWGPHSRIAVQAPPDAIPDAFPDGTVWLHETDEGWQWMTQQLLAHQNAFVALTAEALKLFQASRPPDSMLLGQPAASAPAPVPAPAPL